MGIGRGRSLSALTGSVVALLSVAALAAPLPTFTPAPTGGGNVFSGEPYQITACFNNVSATDPGYAPTIQVVVPAGSTLTSASFLGSSQTIQTIGTCAVPPAAAFGFVNPDTGLAVPLAQNETLAIVRYTLGSFSPTQPPACATLSFALGNTVAAPLDLTRFVALTPIFALGADPLDDPATDPAVAGATVSMPVTPKLIKLTKTIVAPENETATGPNYPRTVNINVQVANGATVTNADVSDVLPGTLQFIPGTLTFTGCAGAVTDLGTPSGATPGGSIIRRCASVTGNGSPNTLLLSFQVFVPNLDAGSVAVVTPAAPTKAIVNSAAVNALFGATPVSANGSDTVTAKLLATRKSVVDVIDGGTAGPSSGDTLEYTVVVDLSDFWSVALSGASGLKVVDTLGDGQTFLGCADANTTLTAQMNALDLSDAVGRGQLRGHRERSGHRQDDDHLRRGRGVDRGVRRHVVRRPLQRRDPARREHADAQVPHHDRCRLFGQSLPGRGHAGTEPGRFGRQRGGGQRQRIRASPSPTRRRPA